MRLIDSGYIIEKEENFCDGGIIRYRILKDRLKSQSYQLVFEKISNVKDYWRRDVTPRFEFRGISISVQLNSTNCDEIELCGSKFVDYLKNDIKDFYEDLKNTGYESSLGVFRTIEEGIEKIGFLNECVTHLNSTLGVSREEIIKKRYRAVNAY